MGFSERMNRTLLERVRCILSSVGFVKNLWREIVMTFVYLINRCPSSAITLKTPEEMWTGKLANYQKLKVIRCLAYAHVKQDKLKDIALKCVMVGYPAGVKVKSYSV